MGFPTWTLIGMGICALLAMVTVLLSLLSQSPRLDSAGTAQQARRTYSLTGWGLAFILLAFGFFVAGVPTGDPEPVIVVVTATVDPIAVVEEATQSASSGLVTLPTTTPLPPTPRSGAGATLPTNTPRPSPESVEEATVEPTAETETEAEIVDSEAETAEEVEDVPTETPEPTPTEEATPTVEPTNPTVPTIEPTPIDGKTAVVSTVGSTLGLRRVPDGESYITLQPDTRLIVLDGVANVGGDLWQEVSTLEGDIGWVPSQWITIEE